MTLDENFVDIAFADGGYLLYDRGRVVDSAYYSYAYLDVSAYDFVHVETHIYGNSPSVCFFDADDVYLGGVKNETSTADNYLFSVDLDVPDDAKTIGISCLSSEKQNCRIYSNIPTQIINLRSKYNDSKIKPTFHRTHKALVWAMNQTEYSVDMINALNKHGYGVSVTNEDAFCDNVDDWIDDFDVLVIGNGRGSMPIIYHHTPTDVGLALQKWINAGKGLIYYMIYPQNNISKLKENCGVTTYNLRQFVGDITCIVNTIPSGTAGTFAHGSAYPSWLQDMIDYRFTSCYGTDAVYDLSCPGFSPLITVTAGQTTYNTIITKDNIVIIGSCGQGDARASGYWRYVDIGYIADMLVGYNEPKMAFDLFNNKRLCAVSVDGDVTTDIYANQAIIDTWNGYKLEIGLVTDKLTDELISAYRSQKTDATYLSHTKSHLTNNTTKTMVVAVPNDGAVMLPDAYFLGDSSYMRISVTDANGNALSVFHNVTVLTETKCYFDASIGLMMFHTSLSGTNVTITYTVIDDRKEWIFSEDVMQTTGLPDNKGVYLTAARFSISPQTIYEAIQKDYVLCDHISQISRMYGVARSGLLDLVTPLAMPTWYNPFTHELFDAESYKTTKANAIANIIPNAIQRCINNNQGLMWYTHDFTVAENDSRSIFTENGKWDADWKKETYAETIANVQSYWKAIIDAIGEIDAKWVTRSYFSRRYMSLNESVYYYTEIIDGTPNLFIRNVSNKMIKGLTFRYQTANYNSAESDNDVRYNKIDGVLYIFLDIPAGETIRIKVI